MTTTNETINPAGPVTFYVTTEPGSQALIDWHPLEANRPLGDTNVSAISATIANGYELVAFGPARTSMGGTRTPYIIHAGDDHVQSIHPGDPLALLVRGIIEPDAEAWETRLDDSGLTLRAYVSHLRAS